MSTNNRRNTGNTGTASSRHTANTASSDRNNNRNTGNTGTNNNTNRDIFKGRSDDLPDWAIYSGGDHTSPDTFTKTTREIALLAGRTMHFGHDAKLSIESLAMIILELPTDPPTNASKTEEKIWEQEVSLHVKRKTYLRENMKALYTIIIGQCTDPLKALLETLPEYDRIRKSGDALGLLEAIKKVVFSNAGEKYTPMAVLESVHKLLGTKQHKHDLSSYLDHFNNNREVVRQRGGSILMPGVAELAAKEEGVKLEDCTEADTKRINDKAEERFAAVIFLRGASKNYDKALESLHNSFIQGNDSYPKDVTAAYHLLTHWHNVDNVNHIQRDQGTSFFQSAEESKEGDYDMDLF